MVVIRPLCTVRAAIAKSSPSSTETQPATPLISARRPTRPSLCEAAIALRATFKAPRTSTMVPLPVSTRSTISGSSTARSASKSPSRGREEGFNDFFLVCGGVGVVGGRVRSADAAASAAGQLARRLGGALEDGADLVEGNREHVVKDVGEPLCRRQLLEHDQQCET
jgi:hypothetical protein